MEALRGWALTACAAALVCSLLYRLFPDNLLGRQGRLLLPCLFLAALLLPLRGVDVSFGGLDVSPSAVDSAALEARLQQQTVAYVNDTLLSMANQALATYDLAVKKVTADMNFTADGGIDMGQITVYIDKDHLNRAAMMRQIIERRLGTAVVMAAWEENG